MKYMILHNWNLMRILRLVIGIFIIGQAVAAHDIVLGLLGGLFSLMALLNAGCCAAGACYTPLDKNNKAEKDVPYEEVV